MKSHLPFLWNFIVNTSENTKSTGGEEGGGTKTASVNEENKSAIVEFVK